MALFGVSNISVKYSWVKYLMQWHVYNERLREQILNYFYCYELSKQTNISQVCFNVRCTAVLQCGVINLKRITKTVMKYFVFVQQDMRMMSEYWVLLY